MCIWGRWTTRRSGPRCYRSSPGWKRTLQLISGPAPPSSGTQHSYSGSTPRSVSPLLYCTMYYCKLQGNISGSWQQLAGDWLLQEDNTRWLQDIKLNISISQPDFSSLLQAGAFSIKVTLCAYFDTFSPSGSCTAVLLCRRVEQRFNTRHLRTPPSRTVQWTR